MDFITGLNRALAYIEDNLDQPLHAQDVAAQAYLSPFHFQRMFSALCGMPLAEYIRCRRLTVAAQELSAGGVRVIDAALRYGYDSPDSFARAFTRFHGVTPSQAKEKGVHLNALAPLHLNVTLEGGSIMEYSITEKPAFTLMGVSRMIRTESSYTDIPQFWLEHMASPQSRFVMGQFGVCIDSNPDQFRYLIADSYTPYSSIPEGLETYTVPAGTWAVFPCRGKLPEALQSVNTRIWKEWLPSLTGYRLAGRYNIEMYTPASENDEDNYSEIWFPLVRV